MWPTRPSLGDGLCHRPAKKEQPVVIVSVSSESQPRDNAVHFVYSLESSTEKRVLVGLKYAVFGCGNSDWAGIYQRMPTLIDNALFDKGAERIAP